MRLFRQKPSSGNCLLDILCLESCFMKLAFWIARSMSIVAMVLACTGCWDSSNTTLDEQKDSFYLRGKNLATSLDYAGAVEAFEKALEVNPRNASAHFELCWLYEQKINNYPAAIYHGERYLKLRPNSEYAEIVRQHIQACIQELAKSVSVGPVTPALQRDFERLTSENKLLRQRIEMLSQELAVASNTLARLTASSSPSYPIAESVLQATTPPSELTRPPVNPERYTVAPAEKKRVAVPLSYQGQNQTYQGQSRTHVVRSGETIYSISRKYRVSQNAILSANPSVNPRRLKAGQVIRIP